MNPKLKLFFFKNILDKQYSSLKQATFFERTLASSFVGSIYGGIFGSFIGAYTSLDHYKDYVLFHKLAGMSVYCLGGFSCGAIVGSLWQITVPAAFLHFMIDSGQKKSEIKNQ